MYSDNDDENDSTDAEDAAAVKIVMLMQMRIMIEINTTTNRWLSVVSERRRFLFVFDLFHFITDTLQSPIISVINK